MLKIIKILWELEEVKTENGRIHSRTGSICFRSSSDYCGSMDTIDFSFSPIFVNFKEKDRLFKGVTIHIDDSLIRGFDHNNNEFVELGTLDKFTSCENALEILDKFIQDFESKYKR